MSIKITCIKKDNGNHYNPHESISHLGWVEDGTGKSDITPLAKVVEWLENNITAYTQDVWGNKAWLYVRTSTNGNKFVQTHSDNTWGNNLLALSECSLRRL